MNFLPQALARRLLSVAHTRIGLVVLVTLFAIVLPLAPTIAARQLWQDVDEAELASLGEPLVTTSQARTLQLDIHGLRALLRDAPLEEATAVAESPLVVEIPLPSGKASRFRVVESPIMARELGDRYPEIRTYRGQGIDDPQATVRFDQTPHGFHAAIRSPSGNIYIDPYFHPYFPGADVYYQSYLTRDISLGDRSHPICGVKDWIDHKAASPGATQDLTSGAQLREYRIAVAATGEYTNFHGGTVQDGMAAIVTSMNRVNGVYEREVAIRMNLVAGNDSLVYTDPATDPYSNSSGIAMLSQNQATLDAVIGDANYDIGHVFSTGGGGVASLGVPCRSGSKARGVTGLNSPTGDVFWIDFVAHEMGHQWGGNHSFNGTAGNCSGGNRNGRTAYEPGSGSTIMAYAGICGSQNLQSNSDDYFHGISFDEIVGYSTLGNGNSCATVSSTGNGPPSVDTGFAYVIPINTPFELCGSATDPNGDPLTFNWEQFDVGPAGSPDSPVGDAPIFRSFPATTSGCRVFPKLDDLLANTQTIGEILPSYDRTLHFRLTARDNRSGGGGVDFDQATVVTVFSGGGPFFVSSPNTAVSWEAGTDEFVIWDVAGTATPPISCGQVDILLSADGGLSYPFALALQTPNDGSESIAVSGEIPSTTQARLKIECSTSIFFDISDVDFEVDSSEVIFADGFESGTTSMWSDTAP